MWNNPAVISLLVLAALALAAAGRSHILDRRHPKDRQEYDYSHQSEPSDPMGYQGGTAVIPLLLLGLVGAVLLGIAFS